MSGVSLLVSGVYLALIAEKKETVARLQSILLGGQLSFAAKSWQNPNLTFESATIIGRKLRFVDLTLA